MPKFDKYKRKGYPCHHIKELFMACQEVAWCDNYLLRLFSKSLSGPSLEWFSKFPLETITTFADLSKCFVAHCHYNIENDIFMRDLCQTKQKGGESLLDYTQRWRALAGCLPCMMTANQLVPIFISNLHPNISYHICLNCTSTFKDIMTKGPSVEKALINEGVIKLYKDYFDKSNHDKQRYWNKNKNVVGDGVTNSKIVQMIVAAKPPPTPQSYVNPSLPMHSQAQTKNVQANRANTIIVSQAPPRQTGYNGQ